MNGTVDISEAIGFLRERVRKQEKNCFECLQPIKRNTPKRNSLGQTVCTQCHREEAKCNAS